jgi:hypothetical protein
VILNINENRGNVIWGQVNRMLSDEKRCWSRIAELKLVYRRCFPQPIRIPRKKLYDRVVELAQ